MCYYAKFERAICQTLLQRLGRAMCETLLQRHVLCEI